jgi:hypothetical protein
MAEDERQLGVIKDILFPDDPSTRYDVYFTDKRVAIVCMGPSKRYDEVSSGRSFLFGVAPEAPANAAQERVNRQTIEQEINQLTINEKLKLSKKSCYYTYQEIEEIKLIMSKKPRFAILSKDCISKFYPTTQQFGQLANLLPTIDKLKEKTTIVGYLTPKPPEFSCQNCGLENDSDANFCFSCGAKMKGNSAGLNCPVCGVKNRAEALYCKSCGSPMKA